MSDITVKFYDNVQDERLKFAVIAAWHNGMWVWCKHRERNTYEIPGGHREAGEDILETAKRELREETAAMEFDIAPVCVYSVVKTQEDGSETEDFGMLFFAEIFTLADEIHSEIERIEFFDAMPDALTYPQIQPYLAQRVDEWQKC